MARTQLPGDQVKDSSIKNVDVASDAAIDITKLALPTSLPDKATPVDADVLTGSDSVASNVWKKFTWANIKATLKTYFDTIYAVGTMPVIKVKSANEYYDISAYHNDDTLAIALTSGSKWSIKWEIHHAGTNGNQLYFAFADANGNPLSHSYFYFGGTYVYNLSVGAIRPSLGSGESNFRYSTTYGSDYTIIQLDMIIESTADQTMHLRWMASQYHNFVGRGSRLIATRIS